MSIALDSTGLPYRLQAGQYYSVETAQAHSSGITYCTSYQLSIKDACMIDQLNLELAEHNYAYDCRSSQIK